MPTLHLTVVITTLLYNDVVIKLRICSHQTKDL